MSEEDTRDIAIMARTMISHHMTDCTQFRKDLREDMATNFKEFRDEFKKINWRIALVIGGLVVITHGIDWLLAWVHH